MRKPYLIYNGEKYLALCSSSEYSDCLIPIPITEMVFLDSLTNDTILDISCSLDAHQYNHRIENDYSLAMDVKLSHSDGYSIHDLFSIVTHTNIDDINYDQHEYMFNTLDKYITDHVDYYIFDLTEFLDYIRQNELFRVYLVLNIPSIVLHRDSNVYTTLKTFFGESWIRDLDFELGEGMYVLEFKTYYMHPQREIIDCLIQEIDDYNQSSQTKINFSVNNYDHPMIRNIGEIHVTLSFHPDYFKKQLFFLFRRLKDLLQEDVTIKIIA